MENNNEEDKIVACLDDRIILTDGRELTCQLKDEGNEDFPMDDSLSLDSTGEYLGVGNKPSVKKETDKDSKDVDLFLRNAFFFYQNAERILSDSKLFLTPVPIQSGLAYTGTSGFRNPTLGVYVEWWLNCSVDITKDKRGQDALTYRLAGSPLSGSNKCSCVYPDGHSEIIVHSSFMPLWTLFIDINQRYSKAKEMFKAYTLEEAVIVLSASCSGNRS